jgi:hypothetical protein
MRCDDSLVPDCRKLEVLLDASRSKAVMLYKDPHTFYSYYIITEDGKMPLNITKARYCIAFLVVTVLLEISQFAVLIKTEDVSANKHKIMQGRMGHKGSFRRST